MVITESHVLLLAQAVGPGIAVEGDAVMGESVRMMQNEDEQPERGIDDVKDNMKSRGPPQFIPKLLNQTIMVRMVDGRPIKGRACSMVTTTMN
ncbi:MAG: hypothetical protein ACXQT2_01215 [Methanotrichaceae archaeon]